MAAGGVAIQLYRPADGPLTQGFGVGQIQGGEHAGSDFAYTANGVIYDKVYAAAEARVIYAGDSRNMGWPNLLYLNIDFDRTDNVDHSAGNYIILAHYDAFGNLLAYTGYGHLEEIYVKAGDWVRGRQHIAKIGQTGFSFGKHLHFDFVPNPYNVSFAPFYGRVDPTPYFIDYVEGEEDDMYSEADRKRDENTAKQVAYLWDQLGPGQSGGKNEGAFVAELRTTGREVKDALAEVKAANKTLGELLFAVTPGTENERPAGATILAILEIVASAQGKTVKEVVEGVNANLADGVEFVLVPKSSLDVQPQA